MFNNIYQGKRVYITGHTGFKGSWLSAWLLALGADVAGFSHDIPTSPSNFESLGLSGRLTDYRGDVRNADEVKKTMSDFRPDIIFHLAAQALVRKSYEAPVATFETNMLGTMNVLEAMRGLPQIRAGVIITSDKCYSNDEWVWGYRETDRLGGADPYSASKGCAEIIAHSYFLSFFSSGPACATVRAGNVIGGGDWAMDRIVPDCARAWAGAKPVEIRSPGATRPWQHVLEPLSGYLWLGARLLEKSAPGPYNPQGQSYNFGPPADVDNTVAEVVGELARYWPGFQSRMNIDEKCALKECNLLKLCCDKALAHLDWKATLNFTETVAMTAAWYRDFYGQKSSSPEMWQFTRNQIDEYAKKARERGLLWAQE